MPEDHTVLSPDGSERRSPACWHAAETGYEGTCYYDLDGYLVGNPAGAAYRVDLHFGGRHTAIRHMPGGHVATVRGLSWPRFPKPRYHNLEGLNK